MAQPAAAHLAHGAASPAVGSYRRRRPEDTALYRCVEQHWDRFLEQAEQAGGLPRFVVREVEDYLRCGRLEHGCLRLACRDCGFERVVALSCCLQPQTMRSSAGGFDEGASGYGTLEGSSGPEYCR